MREMLARCLAGSVLIVVIALLRLALGRRLPRKTFVALWWVALARLLLPVTCPSALSVYTLLARPAPAAASLPAAALPSAPAALPALTGGAEAAARTASGLSPLPAVWAAGSALLALWFLTAYVRCRRRFAASVPMEGPEFRRWLAAQRLRRPLSVRQGGGVDAPLTYGLLRPVILLPAGARWEAGTDLVLAHELAHIRRFDGLMKLALAAALCLYWWDPAVWLLYVLAGRDLELSCDAAVLRGAPADVRGAYARTLISMEAQKSGPMPALHSRFGGGALEERIVSIMKYKKTTVFAAVLAVLLVAGVTTAFATSPREAESAPAAQDTFAYAPLWMQAETEIVYNDDLTYTVLQGGELTEAEIAGREDIAAVGLTDESGEMRVWPGCKVEYDLHGFIQNIYFPVPDRPGEYQLEDPDRDAHRAAAVVGAEPETDDVADVESQPSRLIAVRRDEEANYAPAEWAAILRQVERGEVQLFDTREQEVAYAGLLAFETPGYRDRTMAEFNTALVPDRDALGRRLDDYILVRDAGASGAFLEGTLWQSLSERYGDYLEPDEPYFCPVYLMQPEREDAFASADVYLYYTLPDPAAVTVGERDDALGNIRSALQTYFDGLTDEDFTDSALPQRMQEQCTALAARFAPAGMPMTVTLERLESFIGGQEFVYERTESAM